MYVCASVVFVKDIIGRGLGVRGTSNVLMKLACINNIIKETIHREGSLENCSLFVFKTYHAVIKLNVF